jgi:hypothetical protein
MCKDLVIPNDASKDQIITLSTILNVKKNKNINTLGNNMRS